MSHYKPILYLFVPALFLGASCTQTATNSNVVTNTNTTNDNVNVAVVTNTNKTIGNENTNDANVNNDMDTSSWLTYTNEEYGFSFRYPRDWEVNVLDENTLGLVSPKRKDSSSNSPTEPNSDFYLILNTPTTSAPYIEDDFRSSLEKFEKEDFIADLSFISDERAIFVEHNDFSDQDQFVQYMLLDNNLIISVSYTDSSENKLIIEYIMNSLDD